MNRVLLWLSIVTGVLVFANVVAHSESDGSTYTDPGGYMGAKWGMTHDEVIASMPDIASLKRGRGGLKRNVGLSGKRTRYDTLILEGIPCLRVFIFDDNKHLTRVIVHPDLAYANDDKDQLKRLLSIWGPVTENLVSQFGAPVIRENALGDTPQEEVAEGLYFGTRRLLYKWEFPTTEIRITVDNDSSRLIEANMCYYSLWDPLALPCEPWFKEIRFYPIIDYRQRTPEPESN